MLHFISELITSADSSVKKVYLVSKSHKEYQGKKYQVMLNCLVKQEYKYLMVKPPEIQENNSFHKRKYLLPLF